MSDHTNFAAFTEINRAKRMQLAKTVLAEFSKDDLDSFMPEMMAEKFGPARARTMLMFWAQEIDRM